MLLNCHSHFSLKYGVLSPSKLVKYALDYGYEQLALTDINNTSACMTALYLLKDEVGKQPVIGVDFRNGTQQKYVVLARNWEGFKQINDHLSWHLSRKVKFPERAPGADRQALN